MNIWFVCRLLITIFVPSISPLADEEAGEGSDDLIAAVHLFSGFLNDAVDELKMVTNHPFRGALDALGAVELERRAYGNHYAVVEVRFEHRHEELLFGSSQGYPDDLCAILLYHPGNSFIVEFLIGAEWEFDKLHVGNIGVDFHEIFLEGVEDGLLRAKEDHPVFATGYYVHKDLAATVLVVFFAIDHLDV